jgi:MoaA/NifB/PqqE/SkfB family radical SAM enzyme
MEEYLSCNYIQNGITFYPNDTIKICCFTFDSAVDVCKTSEPINVIVEKIFTKKFEMIRDFRNGKIYDCCKNCVCLRKFTDKGELKPISTITLNHVAFCNLKCSHCGYIKQMETQNLTDSDHQSVLNIIKGLKEDLVTSSNLIFDVGGGEPSLSDGLIEIVQYCIDNNHLVHINSNGARYVKTFADGANKGLIYLTLTPDAGSQQVYKKIKGRDNFKKTWENIKKYMISCQRMVVVKFILQDGNLEDIYNMVETSVSAGVREIVLSLDLNIRKERHDYFASHVDLFRIIAKSQRVLVRRSSLLPDYLWK